jgi:hypothetical protein
MTSTFCKKELGLGSIRGAKPLTTFIPPAMSGDLNIRGSPWEHGEIRFDTPVGDPGAPSIGMKV